MVARPPEAPPRLAVASPNLLPQDNHLLHRIAEDPLADIAHISFTRDARALPASDDQAHSPQLHPLIDLSREE